MIEFARTFNPYAQYLWILIVALAIWAYIYINRQARERNLIKKRQRIEMLPSAISTLGVLGTFLGITFGLLCFDTNDLTQSIPQLLDGLKTAFYTSLAGMIGSLVLSRKVNHLFDDATGGVSDANQAAGIICQSVDTLKQQVTQQASQQTTFYNSMQSIMQKLESCVSSLNTNVEILVSAAGSQSSKLGEIVSASSHIASEVFHLENIERVGAHMAGEISNIKEISTSIISSVGNIESISANQLISIKEHSETTKEVNSRVAEITDHTEAMVSTEGDVVENIKGLTDKLHGEVIEIEDKMSETNGLLERKFDEFSELLKKNNTEALVEVMKQVTIEFQTQMNALINKLVQENFDQLNKSVEKLNKWQVENKQMIQSLTSQYKQMADNFENTSTSLNKVKEDTVSLVSEGGKLDQLVTSLNEVIIHDEKFKQISSDLQKTADLSKSNMENFDRSTRQLNDWVKKQRNFSDAVAVLIQKLEELNEMRNYASQFWKDTKDGMNDAVGIIRDGSNTLNTQIASLDSQFYTRLSTTLANLDACIQSLITNANNRR